MARGGRKSLGLWWRFYVSSLDDAKLDKLSDSSFRGWTKLMCVATENGGVIPGEIDDLAFRLRRPAGKVRGLLQVLLSAGLLERLDDGFIAHNWEERQFGSDISTVRVKQFRERHRKPAETVSETPDETFQNRFMKRPETPDETNLKRPHSTETETETEKKEKQVPEGKEPSGRHGAANGVNPDPGKCKPDKPDWWPERDRYGRITSEITEKIMFDVGKAVLGKSAGGQVTKLRKHYGGDMRAVTDLLMQADEKSDAGEWVAGVLKRAENGQPVQPNHETFPADAYR